MSDPIRSRSGAPAPSYHEALENGAARLHGEDIPLRAPPSAPAPPTVERSSRSLSAGQSLAVKAGKHLGVEAALHQLAHKGSGLLKHAAAGGAKLMAAANFYHLAQTVLGDPSRSPEEKARIRENYGRATAHMASGVLPQGYVQERTGHHQAEVTGLLSQSRESLRAKLGSAERAEQTMQRFMVTARQGAVEGMEFAAAYEVRSAAQLDTLLARDASFRARFEGDPAFGEGVRAMVWLGQHQPGEFEARRDLVQLTRASSPEALVRQMQAR